jgi:hypothetical protein
MKAKRQMYSFDGLNIIKASKQPAIHTVQKSTAQRFQK